MWLIVRGIMNPNDDNVSLMFTIKGYEKSSRTFTTTDLPTDILATVGMQALTGALENIGGRFSDSSTTDKPEHCWTRSAVDVWLNEQRAL